MAQPEAHAIYRPNRGLDEASVELLKVATYAVLGTENPNGSVHIVPVMFLFDEGTIYIETSAATRKARNVAGRPRATVLVQDPRADGMAWVSGTGPATLLTGQAAQTANRRLRSRYMTEEGETRVGHVMAIYDDVTLAVTPAQWLSWNMAAFNATLLDHGVALDGSEGWYHSKPQEVAPS